jgi:hypothetical protein
MMTAVVMFAALVAAADEPQMPTIDGPWTRIAGNPDLGALTGKKQQPVDFAVWQAADGTWQLWSCIRHTTCGGKTRLFYRWEAGRLTDPDWQPRGIALVADPKLGETAGGLQAPHVIRIGSVFHMFYGDWENICHATSDDGKSFTRVVQADGKTGMFTEGPQVNTRDPMLFFANERWHCYYTAFPQRQGAVYCRTSTDFRNWSPSTIVAFGGQAGTSPFAAECPHVVSHGGRYYLFRTQRYGRDSLTSVYHSTDPLAFGINADKTYLVGTLPIAAPEIIEHSGQSYIAALEPGLDGIRLARMKWVPKPGQ